MLRKHYKTLATGLVVIFLCLNAGATQEAQQMDQDMMEQYMKMMSVNENHAYLKKFEGEWDVMTKAWMTPGAEPTYSKNSGKAEMILGGRFLRVAFKGTMFGQPFEGLQIVGYDNHKKKYISFWIDSTSTSFYMTEGTRDRDKNTVTETGLWPDPMTGAETKVRLVTTLLGADEYVMEMYMVGSDGNEFKSLENRSTRKK